MARFDRMTISAPGRICLFGEHQDYLNLPVIPVAISLRIQLEGTRRIDREVHIELPDVSDRVEFSLDDTSYKRDRDYFRSGVNLLERDGFTFSSGFDCTVHGEIPINSGTSSSSALVMAWVKFLALMSDQRINLSPDRNAELAHQAEVVEFQEPGGKMDHYSIANGSVIHLGLYPELTVERLRSKLGTFVLGDSGQEKDTKGILARVKDRMLAIIRKIRETDPDFSLQQVDITKLESYQADLSIREYELLHGTLVNRDITQQARELLRAEQLDERLFGELLNRHQGILRGVLGISTPKIDQMLATAIEAGAAGGKINGSGGGGCMFAYAPKKADRIAEAIKSAGGRVYIVGIDEGVKIEGMVK